LNLVETSIESLQHAMADGRVTALSLVVGYLARIEAYDRAGPRLNAVTQLAPTAAREADALDRERAERAVRSPLHGIPFLVKDNMDVAGMATTAGSRALEGLVADQDAFVIGRLRAAGAIVLGKTNLHEFAAGITTVGSAGGRTRNPYDPERNPGGSSGGTGAAVAASLASFGTGSDTCGSIRIPAAQNALVGLRPTQGLTSRTGVAPLSLTQDVVGPLARTARDLATVLDVMVGADEADPGTRTAEGRRPRFLDGLAQASLNGCRIGRLDTLFGGDAADEAVASIVRETLERLETFGAEVVPVELASLPSLLDVGFTVILGEVARDLTAFLDRYADAPVRSLAEILATGSVHPEVAPLLEAATQPGLLDLPPYREAIENRDRIRRLLEGAIRTHRLDALAYPTLLRVAAPLGEKQLGSNAHAAANSGLPAISVPAGFDAVGHPVGLELLGSGFSDVGLVALAAAIESALSLRSGPKLTPELGPGTAAAKRDTAASPESPKRVRT